MASKRIPLDVDYLVSEYLTGTSCDDLARKFGVSDTTIVKRLKEAGVTLSGHWRALDEAEIVRRYVAGASVLELSRDFGIARAGIDRRLAAAGVVKRTASEQNIIRMGRLSADERKALAAAAHDAVRGSKRTFESLTLKAAKKQARGFDSDYERDIAKALQERGIHPIPQLAIGPYNCDLACHPVAVEIWGGGWHFHGRHLARTPKRIKYLGDSGWNVLMVVVTKFWPFTAETADHIAAYVNEARSKPPGACEYRVVDCRFQTFAAGRCDDDHIAVVPPPHYSRDPATGRYKGRAG